LVDSVENQNTVMQDLRFSWTHIPEGAKLHNHVQYCNLHLTV